MRAAERSISAEAAIAVAQEEIRSLGLTFRLSSLGSGVITYRCNLFDSQNEVSVGNGKGQGAQSVASALFESLEHLVSSPDRYHAACQPATVAEIATSILPKTERVLELLRRNDPEALLPCRTYHSLTGSETLQYPVFLISPDYLRNPYPYDRFDYRGYAKYSTNNGTAIGVNETEACIHSICELLERDALACFLLKTFVGRLEAPVRLIDKGTLPATIQKAIATAETTVQSDLTLVDMTSDFGVPACLAFARNGRWALPHVGAGASLDRSYAVERAVLETVQSFHLHDTILETEDRRSLKRFGSLKRYRDCILLDLASHDQVRTHYNELPAHDLPVSLGQYLDALLQSVALQGYSVYRTTLYDSPSGTTCVHCLIPGLEKFHLVRAGNQVLPSERGMRLVDAS